MSDLKKVPKIAFVMDERLTREKQQILMRSVNAIRRAATVDLLKGAITQEILLSKINSSDYQVIFVPWYRYLAWTRIEAHVGGNRTGGPTFVGYFSDSVAPYELGSSVDYLRCVIVDLAHLGPSEVVMFTKILLSEKLRTGIRPLTTPAAPVYYENWYSEQGMGHRIDTLMSLLEVHYSDWNHRAVSIRLAVAAMWGLVYDDGPGKSELANRVHNRTPKAYFQVAIDDQNFIFRLMYHVSGWTPKDLIPYFWPDPNRATKNPQLLMRYTDFVKVQWIQTPNPMIEITAGLLQSQVSDKSPNDVRTLWIEPVSQHSVSELPYQEVGPKTPWLRPLPDIPVAHLREQTLETLLSTKNRHVMEMVNQVRDLKKTLFEKEQQLNELKAGGVGNNTQLKAPDADALIDALDARLRETHHELSEIESQWATAHSDGSDPFTIEALRKKLDRIRDREKEWAQRLAQLIQIVLVPSSTTKSKAG